MSIDHTFTPYPGTTNAALAGVCADCGDYHDERRTRTQALADKVQDAYAERGGFKELATAIGDAERSMSPDAEHSPADPFRDPIQFRDPASSGPPISGLQSPAAIEVTMPAGRITRAGLLDAFVEAARDLKAAELAFRDAQQVYTDAVKRLSEEAVK